MSYSEIVKVFEAELESDKLQAIDFAFYSKSREYIAMLEEKANKTPSDIEKALYLKEAEIISVILEKLFLLRLRKISEILFRGDAENIEQNLAKEEVEFKKYLLSFLKKIKSTTERKTPSKDKGLLVRFRKTYSRIVLENGSVMGPFHKGDIAYLPRKIAAELDKIKIVDIIA
ncbi:MAG: hypothetical protein DRJ38_01835 [Thermoprotei archaeon]|nr:MAG: hypothetical protein DRJ38_01835 [Thermoprotei archaeon]